MTASSASGSTAYSLLSPTILLLTGSNGKPTSLLLLGPAVMDSFLERCLLPVEEARLERGPTEGSSSSFNFNSSVLAVASSTASNGCGRSLSLLNDFVACVRDDFDWFRRIYPPFLVGCWI